MITQFIIFILGFVFLIYGGNYLVDGASSLAKHLKISDLVIGLTIVSFGTSAPELTVNVIASLENKGGITVGNVIGSNIANILLILGVTATISPLFIKHSTVWKEIPLSLLAIVVFFIVSNDILINNDNKNLITRSDGLILISFFVIFLAYVFNLSRYKPEEALIEPKFGIPLSFFLIILGLTGLTYGGKFVVSSGSEIARKLGFSQELIGFSMIAIGTSLPELFTSTIAAYKKNSEIAIGNVVGSNIFNIFWIMGVSSVINPVPFNEIYNIDTLILIFSTLLLFIFNFTGKKQTIYRKEGILFLATYLIYLMFIFKRG
ncbi:MAG: calcium/sodium antiporter [Proteobacteria bacterium]|nr:calcium/sodium antiporter [Pseudomonadota bacterium]